ncbi:hypothetical protein [Crenobacter cavernae]|uniref:DUF4404 family protein n=1 Tax=Crenobacter cavernae TaxID=2290923 RepID=A0A345Y740_9NEIS|nr:hypothetical protein [Crenobacter cavernae]AXK39742.1 hypothetical protein DWG20_09985 [Crenobacter cavernae]RXZ44111.1 hypothetical protein EBB06_06100 [Crenobacter cavernae]
MEENKLSLADTFNLKNVTENGDIALLLDKVSEIKDDLAELRALASQQGAGALTAKIDVILGKLS